MASKLCLGTAKIGIPDYGYSDSGALENAEEFILESLSLGIDGIDTSPRYGNSEEVIGRALKGLIKKPSISTKIDDLVPGSEKTPSLMLDSIKSSVDKLNVDSIDLCYLHQNELSILSDKYVHKGIAKLKDDGLIRNVGASVYSKEELQYTLESGVFDWVQVPINILDTSFYHMICKYDTGIKVAARSVFLQGILLNHESIQGDIVNNSALLSSLKYVNDLCDEYNVDMKELSIAYVSSLDKVDQIIVGTTSIKNLRKNILSADITLNENLISSLDSISKDSKTWTNPRHWHASAID